jgi:predicted ester cyclase
MSAQENMELSRWLNEEIWNQRNLSLIDTYFSPDFVSHHPMEGQFPGGIDGQHAFVETFATGFPDVYCTVEGQEADGDLVRNQLRFTGTNTGSLMGIPPTGRKAVSKVIITERWQGGKLAETWVEWDPDDLMRQLGVR